MALDNKVNDVWQKDEKLKEQIRKIEKEYPIFSYLPQLFSYDKSKVEPYVDILESLRKEFLTFRLGLGLNKDKFLESVDRLKREYLNKASMEGKTDFRSDMWNVFKTYFNALTQDLLFNELPSKGGNKRYSDTKGDKEYIDTTSLSNTRIELLKKVHDLSGDSFYEHSFTFLEPIGNSSADPSRKLYSVKAINSIIIPFKKLYDELCTLKHEAALDYD